MEEKSFNEEQKAEESVTKKRTRKTRKTKFPLPDGRISVEKLIKVIQALCTSSNKGSTSVSYQDVTPYAGIHETQVSGALSFLYDVDLVEKENYKYTPKQEIVDFCSRLAFKDSNAGAVLRKKLLGAWFGEHIVKLFEIHSEMTKEDLIKNIGIYAQADEYHHLALSRTLDYLVYTKVLDFDETNGKYKLADFDLSQETPKRLEPTEEVKKEASEEKITTLAEQKVIAATEIQTSGDFVININVSIDENSDVEAIAKKIIDLKSRLYSYNNDKTENS